MDRKIPQSNWYKPLETAVKNLSDGDRLIVNDEVQRNVAVATLKAYRPDLQVSLVVRGQTEPEPVAPV